MENFNVNQSSVDRLDTFRAVFINAPMFRLLGKDCKTGVNLSNVSSFGGGVCRDVSGNRFTFSAQLKPATARYSASFFKNNGSDKCSDRRSEIGTRESKRAGLTFPTIQVKQIAFAFALADDFADDEAMEEPLDGHYRRSQTNDFRRNG